jgi:hypothetical protein
MTILDDIHEPIEQFFGRLVNPKGVILPPDQTVRIANIYFKTNSPQITISDASAWEDDGFIVFTVSLTSPTYHDVQFDIAFEDGLAERGNNKDYQYDGATTLTIPKGQREIEVSVRIVDDANAEPEEDFKVKLLNPVSVTSIGDQPLSLLNKPGTPGLGIGRIIDDDGTGVNLTIFDGQFGAAVSEAEEETRGAFTVANLNDTDGDGIPDSKESFIVPANSNEGRHEVDLMKLVIEKPANMEPDTEATLEITSHNALLWKQSDK